MKSLRLKKSIHSLAFFTTTIEENKVKVAFVEIFIVLQNDLVDLTELMLVCVNEGEETSFTINYEGSNGKASFFFNVVPREMGNFLPCNILVNLCSSFAVSESLAHDNQVFFIHHTKNRVTSAVVGQLVILKYSSFR